VSEGSTAVYTLLQNLAMTWKEKKKKKKEKETATVGEHTGILRF
jgi:hypothetical protein